ncbi:MAG TPA: hypothetical protein PKJ08_00210 [Candidatus Cloacimonadota bacterium]|nr:hypothetical protein [Candidatus Cloacimonadota bacterium]
MAYKITEINKAKQLYIVEGQRIEDIANLLKIPVKTVYAWKRKGEWDKALRSTGNIGMAMEMQKAFEQEVQKAIEEKRLTDPATADALYKTSKLMEKLLPKKIMLANIFNMLEDVTNYIKTIGNDKFLTEWVKYLPEISDFLRKKYND